MCTRQSPVPLGQHILFYLRNVSAELHKGNSVLATQRNLSVLLYLQRQPSQSEKIILSDKQKLQQV